MNLYIRAAVGLALCGGAIVLAPLALAYVPVADPVVAKECRACHMLYPAGLLRAESWQRIVGGLQNHFGENASVDAATAQQLVVYLTANAARPGRRDTGLTVETAPLRITELPWYVAEHRGRLTPARLQRKGAKSAADCVACHRQAETGYFDD